MTVTANEYAVLRAIRRNYFTATNGGEPASFNAAESTIWANAIDDSAEPCDLPGPTLSGVCGSLARKGLIRSWGHGRDASIALTAEGFEASAPK